MAPKSQQARFPAFLTPLAVTQSPKWRANTFSTVTQRGPFWQCQPVMSTSMPEVPEVSVPEPPVPVEPMDPELGEATAVVTVESTESENSWLSSALASRATLPDGHPLESMRQTADDVLADLPLPNRKLEAWRFTDLRTVYNSRYARADDVPSSSAFDVTRYVSEDAGFLLVFVDGVFNPALSVLDDGADGATALVEAGGYIGPLSGYGGDVGRLQAMWREREMGTTELGGLFPTAGNAIACDAAVIEIPADFSVARPVTLCFAATGGDDRHHATMAAPRLAVLAGAGSKINLLECHVSMDGNRDFSLALAGDAVAVAENATCSHYIMNNVGANAHVLANLHAVVQAGGTYNFRSIALGGKVGRLSIGIDLEGEGSHGLLHGAIVSDGTSVLDIHSRLCHNALNTTSNQLQKNIATDRGRAVFSGKIVVTPNGDGTDSQQLSRSMLLSERASVDAMPVLEIETDDVQCTHGATVADLRDDELFYLRSRGLTHRQAQTLLALGYAMEAVGDCPFSVVEETVREKVDRVSASSEARPPISVEFSSV